MKNVKRAQDLIGNDIYDQEGNRIGRVGNVYVDDSTHQPEWVTVRTGMFGTKESFVPLQGASASERGINVDVSRNKIREAPRVEAEHGHLSDAEGQDLYSYYGLTKPGAETAGSDGQQSDRQSSTQQQSAGSRSGSESSSSGPAAAAAAGGAGAAGAAGSVGADSRGTSQTDTSADSEASTSAMTDQNASDSQTSDRSATTRSREETAHSTQVETGDMPEDPEIGESSRTSWSTQAPKADTTTDEASKHGSGFDTASDTAPEIMTRYEEQLRVGTEMVETGRVRLRKYIVTEQTSTTVPLTREEVRIEREPIPESERRPASAGVPEMGETDRELVLHEERPVINTEQVPVERIRINAEKITEERTVHGDVRKEQFDIDDQTGKHRAAGS